MTTTGSLVAFVRDSNLIEGVTRDPLKREIEAHEALLDLQEITVENLETFVSKIAGASLRTLNGRSGRALWAWMLLREGRDPFALPVLRAMYYEALEAGRVG